MLHFLGYLLFYNLYCPLEPLPTAPSQTPPPLDLVTPSSQGPPASHLVSSQGPLAHSKVSNCSSSLSPVLYFLGSLCKSRGFSNHFQVTDEILWR